MIDVVVVGRKGKKDSIKSKIKFNSGVQRISEEGFNLYTTIMCKAVEDMGYVASVYIIDEPEAPPYGQYIHPKGLWCPYCKTVHIFKKGEFGNSICPICGVSSEDFYTRKYNNKK